MAAFCGRGFLKMDTNNSSLTDLLVRRMAYLNQRQAVLAENVANASTPKYKARDLAPFTFGDAMKQAGVGMSVTNAHHIIPASMAGVNAKTVKAETFETLPSGNSVDVEQQMMEVSRTAIDYQKIASIYKKIGGLLKIALKGSAN
ncbi:MAG: flagellar basal body rod protein FlgB [Alphaproteobacteria bacterium]|nr:flagellar basal body rod protein FlgB [Alphaproteobacteria bacterium]